ncbi:hypothetical protein ACFYTQ_27090 [Nocardia sp. NPDC004068]|uniref:hypothetical protein n=1 Tax=Nocardia sp. NPDC004068 TaxID=3364303 RepID=UPI003689935C
MDAVITAVATEAKRLIDAAWLGRITRDEAIHRFVQVSDGLVEYDIAEDIIDDGLTWLNAHSTRLRILGWCALLEPPIFGALAIFGAATADYAAAAVALLLLAALRYTHRRFAPHPTPLGRRPRARSRFD